MKILTFELKGKAMIKSIFILFICFVLCDSQVIFPQQINLILPEDNEFVDNTILYQIKWSGPTRSFVKIEYSLDDDSSWTEASGNGGGNNFHWLVPDTQRVECRIRITEIADTTNFDQNLFPFVLYATDIKYIAINEIFMWMKNNGIGSHDPRKDALGLYWLGGINAQIPATFSDGLWWSCLVNGEKRANGSYFSRSGVRPGIIQNDGTPADPKDSLYKIWKIRTDWESLPPGSERDELEFNYNNWPAEIGAPWEDINGDGIFTRGVDLPKFIGDETLWFVSNDLDTAKSLNVFGSLPIGLEFQVTTWGYKSDLLKDAVFKKYKIINKGNQTAEDMILGFWSDDDLGDANDDYPGCDSLLNLGYIFNGDNDDNFGYGTPPPAIGRMIVQPPIVPATLTDSARYGYGWRQGYKNLRMSAYSPGFKNSTLLPMDPSAWSYDGTIEVYNLLHGLKNFGDSLINPHTGYGTVFPLNGDPESGTGWYCGAGWPGGPTPGDRRSLIPSGIFRLDTGDTNEFVIAVFLQKGTDNLNSVTKLKQYAAFLQNWYNTTLVTDIKEGNKLIQLEFSVPQNYPNPFNPSTKISWQSPVGSRQVLKIFDVLGNEIATLVDEEKPAGKYEVNFDASKLASGVYFYRLQAGSFVETKKMMVLK